MIYSFDRTRNDSSSHSATTGGVVTDAVHATLNRQQIPAHSIVATDMEAQRQQAFETSLAIIFLRNGWFFSNLIDKPLLQIRDIVIPILRKVFLHRKYGNCFPAPGMAELALFNCFCHDEQARASYYAYQTHIATGIPASGMAAVPRSADEIQGFLDYYSGHVFARLEDKKTFDEKWLAIRNFGQFLRNPSRFSARRIELEEIHFIDAGTAALVRATLNAEACREPDAPVASADIGIGIRMPGRDKETTQGSCPGARAPETSGGATVHTLGAALLRRERASQPGLAHRRPGEPAPARKLDFSPRSAARENAYRQERRNQRSERSEDALLVTRVFGGTGDCADLQRISALSFSRTGMVGGENFHDTAMAARSFGAPYTPGDYGSAIPDHWFDTLPELGMLRQKYPELI